MKRYYNATTKEWYTEGQSMTRRISEGKVFAGYPSEEQLKLWGFEEYTSPEPSQYDVDRSRMYEIQHLLSSTDYIILKEYEGEDISSYGDIKAQRKALREEYNMLYAKLNANTSNVESGE